MLRNLFPEITSQKKPILLTGHTGFKGTWLTLLLESFGVEVAGFSLPPEDDSLYSLLKREKATKEVYGDVRDSVKLNQFLGEINPEYIIHLAAQPLVSRSYENPIESFEVNVMGTANVLEASRKLENLKAILCVTTDKVYKNDSVGARFSEDDPLGGKDPYSASKSASESVIQAWRDLVFSANGGRVLSARAGNVIGGGDFSQNRLIPDLIRASRSNLPAVIRSKLSTRPWQHVLDPIFGYLQFLNHDLDEIPALNFGPTEASLSVEQVLSVFSQHYDQVLELEYAQNGAFHEAKSLELDSTLAQKRLEWTPVWNQVEAVKRTAIWWSLHEKGHDALDLCKADIAEFLNSKGLKS